MTIAQKQSYAEKLALRKGVVALADEVGGKHGQVLMLDDGFNTALQLMGVPVMRHLAYDPEDLEVGEAMLVFVKNDNPLFQYKLWLTFRGMRATMVLSDIDWYAKQVGEVGNDVDVVIYNGEPGEDLYVYVDFETSTVYIRLAASGETTQATIVTFLDD